MFSLYAQAQPLLLEEDRFYARVMPDGRLKYFAGILIDSHKSGFVQIIFTASLLLSVLLTLTLTYQ